MKSGRLKCLALALCLAAPAAFANPCSPAKAKNPCAAKAQNPCLRTKNPCAPVNPCAAKERIDPKLITRPKGTALAAGDPKQGEKLWNDPKLSTNNLSCNSCHQNHGAFQASFAKPYPHEVAMVKEKAGLKRVALDEMIQACMLMPMAAQPLPWDSRELAALAAHVADLQKTFKPAKATNPCAAKNPCARK